MENKFCRSFQELDWFEEAYEKGDEPFKKFWERFIDDLKDNDCSLDSYIRIYITTTYLRSNLIRFLMKGRLPQVQLLHRFPFMGQDMCDWYEWYVVNTPPKARLTPQTEYYIEKWLDKPEPIKPDSFDGKNDYHKIRRQMSREKWLMKALEMGL